MCVIRFNEALEWEIIYVWNEEEGVADHSEIEILKADTTYSVDIYDTDGSAACLQFPEGEIAVGVPTAAFAIEERCHECDDPEDPDHTRMGALGGIPRYSADRWLAEAELLRVMREQWEKQTGGA